MESKDIEKLLLELQTIVDEKKKEQFNEKKAGNSINLFSILNMETDEVNSHSAFIFELLNPTGSHGLGDTFLKLFIECIPLRNIEEKSKLITNTAIVEKEKYIDEVDLENETGGEIDIIITFKNPFYQIVIENKINAKDQPAQLARYHNYCKSKGKYFTLFYLTKDGHEPSELSTGKETLLHYWDCISYQKHIKQWLERCLKKTNPSSLLSGCIKQYIKLINKITGQEFNTNMNKKILNIMLQHNEEIVSIWENWDEWQKLLVEKVIKRIAKKTNCNYSFYKDNYAWIWDNGYWVCFIPKEYPDIKIWFGKEGTFNPYYYIEKNNITKLQKKLECMDDASDSIHKYGSKYIDSKYFKWDISMAQAILNGEFEQYMTNCIQEILRDPNFPK